MLGGDSAESQLTTPEKKTKAQDVQKFGDTNGSSQKQFTGTLVNGLRGLSQDQLVKMIMDLVSMQEDGVLSGDDKLRDVIVKKMPVADIQPLRERLSSLRQNVYASLVSSNVDDSAYSRAYIHLDAFDVRCRQYFLSLSSKHSFLLKKLQIFRFCVVTRKHLFRRTIPG